MSVIDDLLALQGQDELIRSLEQEVRDIPVRKQQELDRIKVDQDAVEHAKAELAALRADKVASDAQMAAATKQIQDMETSKLSMKTNREYSETNALIDVKKGDLDKIAADNLRLEQDVPALEEALADAQSRYDAAKAGIDSYLAELDERLAAAVEELEKACADRAALVEPLQTPEGMRHLMSYERISKGDPSRRKQGKWPALVSVDDRVCQGCHMELPAAKVQEVMRARSVILCDYCGRMLYKTVEG